MTKRLIASIVLLASGLIALYSVILELIATFNKRKPMSGGCVDHHPVMVSVKPSNNQPPINPGNNHITATVTLCNSVKKNDPNVTVIFGEVLRSDTEDGHFESIGDAGYYFLGTLSQTITYKYNSADFVSVNCFL